MSQVILDEYGIATETGEINIYNFSEKTGEYLSSSAFYILIGSGIPALSTVITPPEFSSGEVAVFNDGNWSKEEDHRGETVYSTSDLSSSQIDYIGAIKDGFTSLVPATNFDEWTDGEWVTNAEKQKSSQISDATAERDYLRVQANAAVVPLQYAVDLEEATDEETALLKKWKQYIVALNRLDLSTAPDITWPDTPR